MGVFAPDGRAQGISGILADLPMTVGVGIDIGSRTTRVVKLTRRGEAVRWAGSVSVSQKQDQAEDLPARLREAGIRTRGGVVGLSGKDTLIRYLRVPPVPPWKLNMLVGYEATQGGELDVSFDYRLLNLPAKAESSELTVMTAIAKNDALSERLNSLAQQGIKGVDFAPDALALYEVFARCPEADEALDQYCLVLDVGASKTEMAIVHNGGLIFARSIALGGRDFSKALASALGVKREQAERLKIKHGRVLGDDEIAARPSAERPMLTALADAAEEYFGAIRASLMFARAQTKLVDLEIGRVYLSGVGAGLKGLPEFLAAKLGVRATPFQPPDEWGVPGEPGRPNEWMIALGLALMSFEPPEERASILPPLARKRRTFWRRNIFAYAACVVFVLAAAVATAARVHNARVARRMLEKRSQLEKEASQRDDQLVALMDRNDLAREQLRLISSAVGSGAQLVEFIDLIKKSQQGPVILSRLVFRPGDVNKPGARTYVTLFGSVGESTRPQEDVLKDFWQALAKSPWFDPPDPANPRLVEQAHESADGSALEFQLSIPLRAQPGRERDK